MAAAVTDWRVPSVDWRQYLSVTDGQTTHDSNSTYHALHIKHWPSRHRVPTLLL